MLILSSGRSAKSCEANERLNIAIIGAGGRGAANLSEVGSENIVALCDVDDRRAAGAYGKYPEAKKYKDYRKLLDEMDRQIDAVVVSRRTTSTCRPVSQRCGRVSMFTARSRWPIRSPRLDELPRSRRK